MKRYLTISTFLILVANTVGAQCREGLPRTGQLGVGLLHCVGGSCAIYGHDAAGYIHRFTVEPHLRRIDPNNPAGKLLRENDVLVALNGLPITSAEGGRLLAQLPAGEPVRIQFRRDGELRDGVVTPIASCDMPMLSVTEAGSSDKLATARDQPSPPPFDLGLEVSCIDCGWIRSADGVVRWHTTQLPLITRVREDGGAVDSGLRVGDVIVRIDGRSVLSEQGARYIGSLRPGDTIVLEVLSGDDVKRIRIRLGEPLRGTTHNDNSM